MITFDISGVPKIPEVGPELKPPVFVGVKEEHEESPDPEEEEELILGSDGVSLEMLQQLQQLSKELLNI